MANPNPEKRVGLALMLLSGIGLYIYMLYVFANREQAITNPISLGVLAVLMLILIFGYRLNEKFKPPKPPPVKRPPFPQRLAMAMTALLTPKPKPKAPPPPKPPPPPPAQRGGFGFLRPKTKSPPKK